MEKEELTSVSEAPIAVKVADEDIPSVGEKSIEEPEETGHVRIDVGSDLEELSEEFPQLAADGPEAHMNTQRYEELRALGLSAKEAYLATSKKSVRQIDNRSHLSGTVPKKAHAIGIGMSAGELSMAREIFGGMSDEEIRSLYRRVTK